MSDAMAFNWAQIQSTHPADHVSYWGPSANSAVILADFIPVPETTDEKFHRLRLEWATDAINLSSLDDMFAHPAYKQIINIGPAVVPYLLAELGKAPNHWFYALRQITGANPIPKSAAGNLQKMASAWLKWGRKNGHL